METEKADLERRLDRSPLSFPAAASVGPGGDAVDHVRRQIPLLSSTAAAASVSQSPSSPVSAAAAAGEQLIRVKLLEQENERYARKVKGLEAQLADLERVSERSNTADGGAESTR